MKLYLNIIIVLFITIAFVACQSHNSEIPYEVGKSYLFKTTVTDSDSNVFMDTLSLTINKKGIIGGVLGMNMATWESKKFPDIGGQRGINIESGFVEIQMPLNYAYLENENIVIPGYPSFSKLMLTGYTSTSKHQFPNSYGKLAGNEIEQYKVVRNSSKIEYNNKPVNSKVAEYENLTDINEFGTYKLKTYYHNEFGFIKMIYQYPNGKKIEFELVDVINES